MLYPTPTALRQHAANVAGTILVGALFALIGLNVASGCGQRDGACIKPRDFLSTQPVEAHMPATPLRHRG